MNEWMKEGGREGRNVKTKQAQQTTGATGAWACEKVRWEGEEEEEETRNEKWDRLRMKCQIKINK